MADVLAESRAASNRGAKRGPNRAGSAPSRGPKKHRKQRSARQQAREPPARHPPARRPASRGPPTREPPARASPERNAFKDLRQANNSTEIEIPSLEDLEDAEAPHGPYDTVGSIQRGVDMFRAGDPTPDVFLPHLAAHRDYSHHLALPYNMEHAHPSLYQGAPLIRGFPAHDLILESMQQNHRENYPGRH